MKLLKIICIELANFIYHLENKKKIHNWFIFYNIRNPYLMVGFCFFAVFDTLINLITYLSSKFIFMSFIGWEGGKHYLFLTIFFSILGSAIFVFYIWKYKKIRFDNEYNALDSDWYNIWITFFTYPVIFILAIFSGMLAIYGTFNGPNN